MNFLARAVRWDIAHSVSRVSSQMHHPVAGTVAALEHLCGYLKHTAGFRIAGKRCSGPDTYSIYTDSDHHGDPLTGTRSHTGVTVLLNGVPIFWRSNKQTGTPALSPMEAEIYALSEGVRDAQDIAWVLEEMGVVVQWPLPIFTDSDGALSFQWNSCPTSKLRGCIDRRSDFVLELQDMTKITTVLVPSKANMANIHTKCLTTKEFKEERDAIMGAGGMI